MRRVVLRSFQSPGDVLMLTAAVRDLHLANPGAFQTDVRTSADALWENNPLVTPLREGERDVEVVDAHYPLIHDSNTRPFHFIHGYPQYLEERLGVRIPVTRFHGEIHLTDEERSAPPPGIEHGVPERFWIMMAGGKFDFTAKWWNPASYQAVVDHFRGRLTFVQCGEAGHWHPPLDGVVNLVGKTALRDFVRLVYHADGVVCPVTFAMHLAAAVETKPGRPRNRACVVVAGGREPAHWEAYPHHQFLSTNGMLTCCEQGGCWKSRCQKVGDGDSKDDRDLCEQPVDVADDLRIPRCMEMITPADVIRRIEMYLEGGALGNGHTTGAKVPVQTKPGNGTARREEPRKRRVLLEFRHGLGDAAQFTIVLRHLAVHRPDWSVDVAALRGKHSAYHGLCNEVFVLDDREFDRGRYDERHELDWHECRSDLANVPSAKPSRCLKEVFGIEPDPALCSYGIHLGDDAKQRARDYLTSICPDGPDAEGRFPAVLIHYEGNTSGERKNLPHEVVRQVCNEVRERGFVPVILDWDNRSPLLREDGVENPGKDHSLWMGRGTGDAEVLAALIEASRLMIGIDSGPLHVAGATTTPTIGVWTQHHPVHFFDLSENVLHLVPTEHGKLAAGTRCVEFFRESYRHETYRQLAVDLPARVVHELTGESFEEHANKGFLSRLQSTSYDAAYYEEHRESGLDYLAYGDWQRDYGRWLVESLDWKGKRVLDVGCACGALLRGLGEAGAVVKGVDVSEHMIGLGRDKWPGMAALLHVCDATNLHPFEDASWDAIHSSQVAEHWKPELVPSVLRELARVTRPDGLFLCFLDTTESFERQGRTIEGEDPTHICIRPTAWWHERLRESGWEVVEEGGPISALHDHPESYLRKYDWDWCLARRTDSRPPRPPRVSHETNGLRERIRGSVHPDDVSKIDEWLPYYERKCDVARRLGVRRICEIGVRAGYSAMAFLHADPQVTVVGIDNGGNEHGGAEGMIDHARTILAGSSFRLVVEDSQTLDRLPGSFELVHVDGDHSYEGTRHDLELAWQTGGAILVDDYGNHPDTHRATDDFLAGKSVETEVVDDKQLLVTRPATLSSDSPIFVSGMPRSGSTWMQWFLCQHPRIHVHGQFPKVPWSTYWSWYETMRDASRGAAASNAEIGYPVAHYAGADEVACREAFKNMCRSFLCGGSNGPPKPRWGLKSLTLCIEDDAVEQVESLWPDAHWIVCIRDPFRTIESAKNTFSPDADVVELAEDWVRMCEFAHEHDPSRTHVFQIDRLQWEDDFVAATAFVLNGVGEEQEPDTREFARRHLRVHDLPDRPRGGFLLSASGRTRLLESVRGLRDAKRWLDHT